MKRIFSVVCSLSLVLMIGACSNSKSESSSSEITTTSPTVLDTAIEEPTTQVSDTTETSSEDLPTDTQTHADVLVVVFSQTGHTRDIAMKIASIENADLYEIAALVPYTEEDLNYNDSNSRATVEQNDPSVRPEIGSETIDLSGYAKIYVGYPIWWGQEPRIMDTFVESYDFGDATVIPFCTSGSSGIGSSGTNLAKNAGSGNWLEGKRFSSGASEDEVREWIGGLN